MKKYVNGKYIELAPEEIATMQSEARKAELMEKSRVKLKITENAKRSSAFGRKCRCSEAVVLAIENVDGTPSDKTEVFSQYDRQFVYRVGKTVSVSDFDDDRKNECSPGIHFFITRQEAVDY